MHVTEERVNVTYISDLLPKLMESCHYLLTHGAKVVQDLLSNHWPPNSPVSNLLDYHVCCAVLEECNKLNPKPQNSAELKVALQMIWDNLLVHQFSNQSKLPKLSQTNN